MSEYDIFLTTPSVLKQYSAYYFLFDARDPDSLQKVEEGYNNAFY